MAGQLLAPLETGRWDRTARSAVVRRGLTRPWWWASARAPLAATAAALLVVAAVLTAVLAMDTPVPSGSVPAPAPQASPHQWGSS